MLKSKIDSHFYCLYFCGIAELSGDPKIEKIESFFVLKTAQLGLAWLMKPLGWSDF